MVGKRACKPVSGTAKFMPALEILYLCQPKRKKDTWLSVNFTRVLHVGAVEGNTLSVSMCMNSYVSVLCVCLWDKCSASLLVEHRDRKVTDTSLSLGREPGLQDTTMGSSGWVAPRPEQLYKLAVPNTIQQKLPV